MTTEEQEQKIKRLREIEDKLRKLESLKMKRLKPREDESDYDE